MLLRLIFCLCVYVSFGVALKAQKANTSDASFFPTEKVDVNSNYKNVRAAEPKRENISYIYKRSSGNALYGNPCAVEATRKMKFEYVLQPTGVPGSQGFISRSINNVGVNLKLIFTRSPFWKIILNKRIKQCRINSGDIVG